MSARADRVRRAVRPAAIAAVVVSCATAACGPAPESERSGEGSEPAAEAARDSAVFARPSGVDDPAANWIAHLDRPQLVDRFGAPDSVVSIAVPNRHDPAVTDSVVVLHYPRARYTYYVVTAGSGAALLEEATISDNAHLLAAAPRIGTPADSLRAWLLSPIAATDSTLEYDCRHCEVPNPVTLVIRDGALRELRFDFYVD